MGTNQLKYISAEELMANIRSDFSTYNEMGLINTQKLYKHIRWVLSKLGLGVYEQYNAVIDIESYKGELPRNFTTLHAAFRVQPTTNDNLFSQVLGKFTYFIEENVSCLQSDCNMSVPAHLTPQTKIEYKTIVKGQEQSFKWSNIQLLKLAPRTEKTLYTTNCINVGAGTSHEFSIDINQNKVYTNFEKDAILLQYYGFPLDVETNLPKVPEDPIYYTAVETYLKYKIYEDLWNNSTIADIERKYQKAEINFNKAMKEALYYVKLFTFNESVDMIRNNKNKFSIYSM